MPEDSFQAKLIGGLDDEALALLAERLAPHLALHRAGRDHDDGHHDVGWLNSDQAAAYLGVTRHALHKYTAAGTIPFEQECVGGKCWFLRDQLDDWRRGKNVASDRSSSR